MTRPKLSICIPTYNRAKFLQVCLESAVAQLEKGEFSNIVEIVIADNDSQDNTKDVVASFQKRYHQITYFKNEKNIGFDRSFARLIERSTGEYCLCIGDDDAFFEETIPYILEILKDSNTPFYWMNNWGYDHELEKPVLPYPSLTISKDEHYEKLSDYIHSIRHYTNIVGMFVGLSNQLFKRDLWVAFPGKEKFFDTLAIHMYILLSIYKDSPYAILAKPIIKTRSSNIRWDVFAGLESASGRIRSTITIVLWIKKLLKLPIPSWRIYMYFYVREYWFTGKEIIKIYLQKFGLKKVIDFYRSLR